VFQEPVDGLGHSQAVQDAFDQWGHAHHRRLVLGTAILLSRHTFISPGSSWGALYSGHSAP
ncbi:MAG TPA: hypothetical protein VE844_10215, partial [Gammaproteobacteria bacterium]|nr:hypothetical protein [Gammaproteobacteria bacterium]